MKSGSRARCGRRVLIGCCMMLLTGLIVPATAHAQRIPTTGSAIRFSTDSVLAGRWTTGRYISLDERALRLVSSSGDSLVVPRQALYHFEMSDGRYAHPKAGALLGLGIGAAGAFLLRSIACKGDDRPADGRDFCQNHGSLKVTAIGGLVGGGLGALIGQVAKTDRWRPLPLERDLSARQPR